jgi:hypothetical protein
MTPRLSEATMSPNLVQQSWKKIPGQGLTEENYTCCGRGDCPSTKAQESFGLDPCSEENDVESV